MARTISLGSITLTLLQDYQWRILLDGSGALRITEEYVVTDDGYTAVPEGRRFRSVALTNQEIGTLVAMFQRVHQDAALRESVAVSVSTDASRTIAARDAVP